MAPSVRHLQLTQLSAAGAGDDDDSDDLEDVRLLDAYKNWEENDEGVVEEATMKRVQVGVTGMTCAACSNSVEAALMSVNGVLKASVALLQNKADVVFDPRLVKVGWPVIRRIWVLTISWLLLI